ncbi:MAG: helix-turn-helix domain-containing protein [Clostridia bacterium]|nr:helix-turn-helix domain-containing protein [Clostridia bacterium]
MNYTVKIPSIDDFQMTYYSSAQEEKFVPKTFPPHVHDELEVYILVEGDVSFMVENNLYKLSPGDALLSKPNEMHNCILNSESVHKHLCFWFNPNCSFLLGGLNAKEFGRDNLVSPEADREEVLALCKKLSDPPEKADDLQSFSLAVRLIALLDKNMGSKTVEKPTLVLPPLLKEILKDLNENFAVIDTLEYFKEKYFISQSTLNRLFKNYLHTTPHHYLETKKLAQSRILLKKGKSVFDACLEAGFADYSNYIRLFKKRFGVTPKQYLTQF